MKSTLKFLILFVLLLLVAAAACSSNSNGVTPGSSGTSQPTNTSTGSTGGGMCVTGQKDCGGVCKDIVSDSQNCGGCGAVCGTGQICMAGNCQCQGSLDVCGGSCVNTNADAANCGDCGVPCADPNVCDRGMCAATCSAGLTNCNRGCTNPLNDPFNCGTCGTQCGTGQTCGQGQCVCADGSPVCNGVCTNVTSDPANCGACGTVCPTGQTCTNRVCSGGTVTSSGPVTASTGASTTTTAGTTTTGAGGATSSSSTGNTTSVGDPDGWWTYAPLSWAGCAWTGIDTEQGSTTIIMPQDFTTGHAAGDPYCVSGTVHDAYESVALLGFNLAEDKATADCTYNPTDAMSEGPPGVTLGGTGIAVNFDKSVASTFRIQIQGPNGATEATDRWCATITEVSGKVFVPYTEFYNSCWETAVDMKGNQFSTSNPVSAVVFLVPGQAEGNFTEFGYCINGFATGTSADDAPDGGGGGTLMGDIGGAGSDDNDYARVKVLGSDGKEYVIQNNNWGNPGGSNQTLSYVNNSFKITQETGGTPGNGVPASFPSIFIGHNGDRAGGNFSTNDSNLPKQVSSIASVPTKFSVARSGGIGGDYNVAYDVWFAASDPGETVYEDGISGFLMIWMYKPGSYNPIGWESGSRGTFTGGGHTFNVYVGNRDSSSNRPVVNYVANGETITSMDFDLKAFIDDASKYGIQSSWYLTDVFGGFEIWNGSGTNGLEATEFTAVVN